MNTFTTIEDISTARWANPSERWGLVPTMGFLHEGHLSLVRQARQDNDRVGVTIFVNPAQFNQATDLENYPRNLERDLAMLAEEGVDLVWTPTPDIVYPADYQTYIEVETVSKPLEGAARPAHFRGVATVVAKLFNVFQPNRVYFGQKDAQQVVVIQQMARDLNFNLEVVVCPTIREADGLAMSSRNANLSPEARQQALCLYQALLAAKAAFLDGQRDANQLRSTMTTLINSEKAVELDYVSVAQPQTLQELDLVEDTALFSLAAFVGGVRLIDNLLVNE